MKLRIALFAVALGLAQAATAADEVVINDSVHLGGTVDITETVEGPLTVAAGNIRVQAPVHGDARMAGGKVEFARDASVSGDVALAGGTVVIEGPVTGTVRAVGGTVTLDGAIGGDAKVAAGTLKLGPDARIAGHLDFTGGEMSQDAAAQVTGGVTQHHRGSHRWHRDEPLSPGARFLKGWLWTAGLIALAALLAAALPGPSRRMALELRERPWLTPLLGLVALSTIPVAAVLVMITIIGIPLGLLALMGYGVLLLLGYVWLAVVVGGLLLDRIRPEVAAQTAWRVGAAMIAMLSLGLLARMPFVGGLIGFVALVVGVGMVVGALLRRASPPAATAAV